SGYISLSKDRSNQTIRGYNRNLNTSAIKQFVDTIEIQIPAQSIHSATSEPYVSKLTNKIGKFICTFT
ncbi:hypothetical protein GJ496_005461, partial [Pomphorhynchus laevis]